MHTNDNRTVLDDYFRSLHPKLTHLPDYGLMLEPEDDARFRAQAEAYGIDYDQIKKNFSVSYQVIPPRPHKIGMTLIDKNAIPLNYLKTCFAGMISGAIFHVQRQREKSATAK